MFERKSDDKKLHQTEFLSLLCLVDCFVSSLCDKGLFVTKAACCPSLLPWDEENFTGHDQWGVLTKEELRYLLKSLALRVKKK